MEEYVQIAGLVDAEFARNRARFGARMQCRLGCTDCCHHLFDVDSLEARRIATHVAQLPEAERNWLRDRALAYRERRAALQGNRLACAALDDDGACRIYAARPLVCRKFGMPIYDPRQPRQLKACELNFRPGEEIDSDGIVERQTEIFVRWEALKSRCSDGRRYTVAEAILMAGDATAPAGG